MYSLFHVSLVHISLVNLEEHGVKVETVRLGRTVQKMCVQYDFKFTSECVVYRDSTDCNEKSKIKNSITKSL